MAKKILIEEFHVSILLPARLTNPACTAVRRTLNNKRFQARLRDAIGNVFRRYPSLNPVKFSVSR